MQKTKLYYLIACILLFLTELANAFFVRDGFVRPFVGDVLVVILIYCFLRLFVRWSALKTILVVLLFAYTIEVLQLFGLVKVLGLQRFQIVRIILGTTFEWTDFVTYTLGGGIILLAERRNSKRAPARVL